MQIMPPSLSEDTTKKSNGNNRSTWPDFMPNKLAPGQSEEFRLMGTYSSGHASVLYRLAQEKETADGQLKFSGYGYFNEFPTPAENSAAREVDWANPARPKIDGSFVKPKRAMVWIAWSAERQRPELLIVEQSSISSQLVEIMKDEDFSFSDDLIANFTLKITRKGSGLETSYSMLPKLSDAPADVTAAFEEIKTTSGVAVLTEGKHPLIQKTEFKPATGEDF